MSRLRRLAIVAKPSAAEDFQVVWSAEPLPDEVRQAARRWLQLYIESGDEEMTALVRLASEDWLLRAAEQSSTDAAGRPRCYLALGQVAVEARPADMLACLRGAQTAKVPSLQHLNESTCDVPCDTETDEGDEDVGAAMLTLCLDAAPMVVVGTTAGARSLLDVVPVLALDYVVILASRVPNREPPGRGIVISPSRWFPPLLVERLIRDLGAPDTDIVRALCEVDGAGESKERLYRAALAGAAPGAELTDAELRWLLSHAIDRKAVLAALTRGHALRLIEDGALDLDDLRTLQPGLVPQDAPLVAPLAARAGHEGFEWFRGTFGDRTDGLEHFLSPGARDLWHRVRGGDVGKSPPEDLAQATEEFERLRLLDSLSLAQVSKLHRHVPGSRMTRRWVAALEAASMPAPVVRFMTSGIGPGDVSTSVPAPEPDGAWLCGVEPQRLLDAAAWACRDAAWRRWWLRCVERHPDLTGSAAAIESGNEWSTAAGWWSASLVRDGELAPGDFFSRVAHWRSSARQLSRRELSKVLELAGFAGVSAILDVADGRLVQGLRTIAAEREVALAARCGAVTLQELVSSVSGGLTPALLKAAGVDGALVALLDPAASPPVDPPTDWHAECGVLLSQQIEAPEFWARWPAPDGIPRPLVDWLAERAGGGAGGALLLALRHAFDGRHVLTAREVGVLGPALPSAVVCQQAIRMTTGGSSDERTLEQLLSLRSIRPIAAWLRTLLTTADPLPAVPTLSAGELAALLPMLHPTRDVLREIMARETREPAEAPLLAVLLDRLMRWPELPLSRPSVVAARRRPDWVRAISRLPGWQHWCDDTVESKEGR